MYKEQLMVPWEGCLFRGYVEYFDKIKGFGFIEIRSIIMNFNQFDYNLLQPIGKKALVHYNDIFSDIFIEKSEKEKVQLKVGQYVYFNLEVTDKNAYKATNVMSEFIMTNCVIGEANLIVKQGDGSGPKIPV